ncbi:50S ribosomal protein L18 [Candidatus Woesearchaeota archaeon]|nr:50S ribosomal protein L18 [Candidatus Woesearchaeota archaeon]
MKKINISLSFKRKREGKTHYKKRLKILLSNKFRLVVRKSLNGIKASIVEYNPKGDKIIFTVDSKTLGKFGWKGNTGNLPSAYLTGMIAGKKAVQSGIKEAILDIGLNNSTKGSRLYAALAGALDAGMKIPSNTEVLPPKERVSGEHISQYAQSIKNDRPRYEKQFYTYLKNGLNPEDIVKHFNDVKGKIHG